MRLSSRNKWMPAVLVLGLVIFVGGDDPAATSAMAQSASSSGQSGSAASNPDTPPDPYQRSGDVFYMKRMGESGWQRGQEIYYMKCWFCHNDYTRAANPNSAPTLKELYKRPALLSGQPVNDETVKAKIREGGPGMPGYRYGLNDKDLADLVAYLREKCCWDQDNPPVNPRFRNR